MGRRKVGEIKSSKLTISVPGELQREIWRVKKEYGLNISRVCQRALRIAIKNADWMFEITTA